MILNAIYITAATLVTISILATLYRVFKGPSMPDRVIALDVIGIQLISLTALFCIILNTRAFIEVMLLLAILAFIGTVAFAKYIEKGVVIEHDRDS
ncbi:multisubunit sodium/proton antiporter, MrpF subunit [Marinococcus luteus]|uniref:Multisubunit sodium/proton antiporter, MrpF subunit n=1 Tax=Marinococcus luteus TaxID=1122204 RepID=A0A1H2S4D2_9BACI|nr:Na(+)/H(+) antiporter subunit F1 [Marinococcus luteus]SDW26418.1 multisubunit sodium/proton antiporter, MrpF subunit [Marinococcus luteus]